MDHTGNVEISLRIQGGGSFQFKTDKKKKKKRKKKQDGNVFGKSCIGK